MLLCMRPDGRFARVFVGNFGPNMVWWVKQPKGRATLANMVALGKKHGDQFWSYVVNGDDLDLADSPDPDLCEGLPSRVIDPGVLENYR